METLTLIMVTTTAILGPSIVVAIIGFTTIKALARNPSSAPILLIGMLVMLIFNQAIVIVSLLVFFQVFNKLF